MTALQEWLSAGERAVILDMRREMGFDSLMERAILDHSLELANKVRRRQGLPEYVRTWTPYSPV